MAATSPENGMNTERWDQLYDALSAQPRRMVIFSLLREPAEEHLPLPDAAQASGRRTDSEDLCIQLRHRHLPMLADAGYIRWESDPFRVRRGPHFDEPALVISRITGASVEYPERLRDECVVLGGVEEDDPN